MDQLQQELKAERARHQETGRQLSQLKKVTSDQQEELDAGQRKERDIVNKVICADMHVHLHKLYCYMHELSCMHICIIQQQISH